MLHVVVGALIFYGCAYAVFSARVNDGFIGRHLLTFSAIAGAGYAYSGELRALLTAYVLLLIAALWATFRKVLSLAHD